MAVQEGREVSLSIYFCNVITFIDQNNKQNIFSLFSSGSLCTTSGHISCNQLIIFQEMCFYWYMVNLRSNRERLRRGTCAGLLPSSLAQISRSSPRSSSRPSSLYRNTEALCNVNGISEISVVRLTSRYRPESPASSCSWSPAGRQ